MKKRIISFAAGCLALALIVGSWAFYSATNTVDNQLKTTGYGDTIKEKFTPDTNWQPGETASKVAGVTNTGDAPLVVRMKLNEVWWKDANGNNAVDEGETLIAIDSTATGGMAKINYANGGVPTQPPTTGTPPAGQVDGIVSSDSTVVYKNLTKVVADTATTNGWVAGTDGWWYYNDVLDPNETTENFIESITLAKEADMGKYTTVKYWRESATDPAELVTSGAGANVGTNATTHWVVYTGAVPSPSVATNTVYTRSVSMPDPNAAGYAKAIYDLFITSETLQATADAVDATWTSVPAGVETRWGL